MHSSFSADSNTPMEQQISRAQSLGLDEICFTEHLEYDFHLGDWHSDLDAQRKHFHKIGPCQITVKLGAEIGVSCSPENLIRLQSEVKEQPLDFVILSIHKFHDSDPIHEDLFAENDITLTIQEYLSLLNERMRMFGSDHFSALAHIDYLAKGFGQKYLPGGCMKYWHAPNEMDSIFRYLIENGKCIEINTSTYRGIKDGNFPGLDWLKRYRELGGDYVTIGADAHIPEHVGLFLKEAMELAKEAGLRYIATFNQMKPTMHKIRI